MRHFSSHILYIDDREPSEVKEYISTYFNTKRVKTKITRLESGDFFYNGILIERKDCFDFVSSWKDSRLQNQRISMLEKQEEYEYHPYVIIMGTFSDVEEQSRKYKRIRKFSIKNWIGGITSLTESGINVVQVEGRKDYEALCVFIELLEKHYNDDKPLRRAFIEPDGNSWNMKVLQCIPGVGFSTARLIDGKYHISELIDMDPDEAYEGLISIKGLGDKIVRTVLKTIKK